MILVILCQICKNQKSNLFAHFFRLATIPVSNCATYPILEKYIFNLAIFFLQFQPWFRKFVDIENSLMANQIISSPRIFSPGPYKRVGIEDDHVPFMQRSMKKYFLLLFDWTIKFIKN